MTGIPPEPVLKVLSEQLPWSRADKVGIAHTRRDIHQPSSALDPVVELVVLVPDQSLVKESDAAEHPTSNRRKGRSLSVTFVVGKSVGRIADAERMRHRQGRRLAEPRCANVSDRAANAPCLGMFLQEEHVLSDEVRCDDGMAVNPDDDLTSCPFGRRVQSGGDDLSRIVHHNETGIAVLQAPKDLTSTVIRHAHPPR